MNSDSFTCSYFRDLLALYYDNQGEGVMQHFV